MMLENLDTVNWAGLGAPQMPDLLREIQSPSSTRGNNEQLRKTWDELRQLLFPEGIVDVWDWSAPGRMMQNDLPHHTVPFLIEILKHTTSQSTASAMFELLGWMAAYDEYKLWVGESRYDAYLDWATRLKAIIRQGIPIYERFLDDPYPYLDEKVRVLLKNLADA
jgi:hypothetical protein